jgi:hypothetical protein
MKMPSAQHPIGIPREGFFAANDDQIDEALVNEGPGPGFAGVEVKMISPVEVARLGEIVGAGSQASGWQPDDVREIVTELLALASGARAEDKSLWVWWSL